MILQSNLAFQVNNIIYTLLKRSNVDVKKIESTDGLKKMYHFYLNEKQKRIIEYSENTRIIIDRNYAEALKQHFDGIEESRLDDLDQKNVILSGDDQSINEKKLLIEKAIDRLKELSEDHYNLLNILITDIFIMPSNIATGGSSSESIGLIWANPKIDYPVIDIVEFIVHEMTHNCMFIDEHNYLHYDYTEILKKENWAMSAILKRPRPIDKVLHSIIVSVEIILFRDKIIGHPNKPKIHPPTNLLIDQTLISIKSLEDVAIKNKNILTDRALSLLDSSKLILVNL